LLYLPYGSKDPYKFYRVPNVENKATLLQIEAAYRKVSVFIIPTGKQRTKTPGRLDGRKDLKAQFLDGLMVARI